VGNKEVSAKGRNPLEIIELGWEMRRMPQAARGKERNTRSAEFQNGKNQGREMRGVESWKRPRKHRRFSHVIPN